jgi:hypothetical protein
MLRLNLALIAFVAAPAAIHAQNFIAPIDVTASVAAGPALKPTSLKPSSPLSRWLEIGTFTHSERYRNQYGDDGYHYFENGQQRTLLTGRVKLDADAKYTIGFRASTGNTFNWSYGDYAGRGFSASISNPQYDTDVSNPAGDPAVYAAYQADPAGVAFVEKVHSQGWSFFPRELYFSAQPVKQLTLQFGSFGFERGFSTEITTFDDDGYLTGERIVVEDRKHLYFDKVTLTSAYFGYFNTPDVFERGGGFSKSNYRQLAVKKQLSKRVGLSGEYNWISNNARTSTTREAIVVNTPEIHLVDRVRLESYQMLTRVSLQGDDEAPRQGVAIAAEKKIGRLGGDFGFASIDRNYGLYTGSSFAQEVGFSLNGDNYNTGIRFFSHLNMKIAPGVSAFGFYTRITGENITNLNRQGLNAGLTFDVKELINKERNIF